MEDNNVLNEIQMPHKPRLSIGLLAFGLFFIAGGVFMLCLESILIGLIELVVGTIIVWFELDSYISCCRRYKLAHEDFEAYKQLMLKDQARLSALLAEAEKRAEEKEERQEVEMAKLPVCPICGRKNNVKRISTLNRTTSVAAFGLASSKIGKQYTCTNCKHHF